MLNVICTSNHQPKNQSTNHQAEKLFHSNKSTKRHLLFRMSTRTHFRSSRAAISHSTLWYSLAILQCSLYTRTLSFRDTQGGTGCGETEEKMSGKKQMCAEEEKWKIEKKNLNSCSSQLTSYLMNFSCLKILMSMLQHHYEVLSVHLQSLFKIWESLI